MRQTRCTLVLSKQRILAVTTAAVLTLPVWASKDIRNSDPLSGEKFQLKAAGWTGTFGPHLPLHSLPDKVELLRTATQLVDGAANYLPKEIAAKVSGEMKQEIARIAEEAFERAILEERTVFQIGQTGPLRYKAGALWYSGDTYIRGTKVSSGWNLAPVIALMPAGRARSMEAEITVHGMPAEAEIFFDGEVTTQTGNRRKYFTSPLEVGKSYQYEVVARWQEKGKEVKLSRQVSLTGGDAVNVDFYFIHRGWIYCKWARYTGERKASKDCSFAYGPDRKTIVKVLDTEPNAPKKVRLYDATTNKPLGPEIVLCKRYPVLDPSTGKPVVDKIISPGERVVALAVAPDGKTVAATLSIPDSYLNAAPHLAINQPDSLRSTNVDVWDATTGTSVGAYMGPALSPVFDLSFIQNGKYVSIAALPKEGK